MPELTRKQDQEVMEKLNRFSEEQTALRSTYATIRTQIGTSTKQGKEEFFVIIEALIDLASAQITQCENQKKQAEICVEYVDGFEVKYRELKGLISDNDRRLKEFEQAKHDESAVKTWFGTKSQTIITISKTLIAIGAIMTIVTFWLTQGGLI